QVTIGILCLAGTLLSGYAYYVEVAKEFNKDYQALCDISAYISCSKVFTSKYGRGFGVIGELLGNEHPLNQPNSVFGAAFYFLLIILGLTKLSSYAAAQHYLALSSNIMSLYLAYLLYFVLHDFCIICVSTYVVNILLTIVTYIRLHAILELESKSKKNK
ncbi:unnamed protein product, partial [Meganyctiphanes norvegica]